MNEMQTCNSYGIRRERQEAVPAHYLPSDIKIDTSSFMGIDEKIWPDRFRNKPTPVFAVGSSTLKLITSKPILVSVHLEDGIFIAENETLGLYGIGDTQEEAIEELKSHILYFYQYYKQMDWSQLIGEAIRLKALYERLFLD